MKRILPLLFLLLIHQAHIIAQNESPELANYMDLDNEKDDYSENLFVSFSLKCLSDGKDAIPTSLRYRKL